jgi:hypothetical protein
MSPNVFVQLHPLLSMNLPLFTDRLWLFLASAVAIPFGSVLWDSGPHTAFTRSDIFSPFVSQYLKIGR